MNHPHYHAQSRPNHPAIIMADTGVIVTYAELERRANQTARFFRELGLLPGSVVAICMDNSSERFFDIVWAAQRTGLYFTCISTKLKTDEIEYILNDSGAKAFFGSASLAHHLEGVTTSNSDCKYFSVGGDITGFSEYESSITDFPESLIANPVAGADLLYSSGTTGRPKGIKPPLTGGPIEQATSFSALMCDLFGINQNSCYLSPAPLYHTAPLRWCMTIHRIGGTAVVMDKWDEEFCLQLIEKHKIDCVQFVPTHFVRMLKLPQTTRDKYNVSSLKTVVHAAAPCPVDIKEQMFDWFGPIIHEYYAGTEGVGLCYIGPEDWLTHKGSVGKALVGEIHICDEQGVEVKAGQQGDVYFGGGPKLSYHNAPEKQAEAMHKNGWATMGDIGRVDADGFLYLTDRKSFTIISGGVNVYPQEIEDTLISHPDVMDVAVIGVPDQDFGERVLAVVQLREPDSASDALAKSIMIYAEERLSKIKTPKQIDFRADLPRHPNGKLYKRLLKDEYWENTTEAKRIS